MTKLDFLMSLREKLLSLPQDEVKEQLNFYCEMIEDRTEEGLSEEEAVSAIGSIAEIAEQIQQDIGNTNKGNTPVKHNRRRTAWEFILLILGSPIWLSLLIAVFAVVLSLYISLWVVVVSLWAVFVSLIACAFGAMVCGIGFCCKGNIPSALVLISASLICAGLGIFAFFGCKSITNLAIMLIKKAFYICKKILLRKEEAQ